MASPDASITLQKGDRIPLDKKLLAITTLTLLVVIPVCSVRHHLEKIVDMNKELKYFCTIWIFLCSTSLFWRGIFFLRSSTDHSNGISVNGATFIRCSWCSGLVSSFLIFLRHSDYILALATDKWGDWAGPGLLLSFGVMWLYTVFNFYFDEQQDRCKSCFGGEREYGEGNFCLPRETQFMTLVLFTILCTVGYLGQRDLIPNWKQSIGEFLKIWASWIIMFTFGYYQLMKDDQLCGSIKIDFRLLTWYRYWDLLMMTALISFIIAVHRAIHGPGSFHMIEYYCFCCGLTFFSYITITLYRWLAH